MPSLPNSPLKLCLLLVLTGLLSACGGGGSGGKDEFGSARERAGDEAIARVNGTTIYASDIAREAAAQKLIRIGDPLPKGSDTYKQVLDDLVDQRLLALEAVRRGLDRDGEAKRRLQAARERILGNILVENAISKAVTDEAIRRMYEEQAKLSPPGQEVRARHILVKTKAEAEAIIAQLKNGADFAKLALEKSIDPGSRLEGGELGYFSQDAMVEPFAKAAFALKKGEISEPVQTEFGWHVIQVEARRKQAPPSFDEMRPRIVRFMTFDEIQKLITQLRMAAIVERDDTPKETEAPMPVDGKNKAEADDAATP
ncbi:MAG: peptidylprolyl isomerase [Robiginitomaculum sp.]|nr:peptidylprolyl isomerase [Robiginitomaculum sp.]MDQ7076776.1 peptidylprolyl isomerase [Robiginitomaculum sp.]